MTSRSRIAGDAGREPSLSVIEFPHFWWHQWCAYAAHAFIWIGFWLASYLAWARSDLGQLALSTMLLGIGLLVFRGVAFIMNAWVIYAAYISHREIREELEESEQA